MKALGICYEIDNFYFAKKQFSEMKTCLLLSLLIVVCLGGEVDWTDEHKGEWKWEKASYACMKSFARS